MTRENPICPHCKSNIVVADATAYWNASGQYWQLCDTFNTYWCGDCGNEIEPEWVSDEEAA